MRCSRSGEQSVEIISTSEHHRLFTMQQTPPLLLFSEFIVRSWRWMETPSGTMAESGIEGSSILLRSSSSLLSSDWTLAKRIHGSGGRFSHFLSLSRTPARDPCFLRRLRDPGTAGKHRHGYSLLLAGGGFHHQPDVQKLFSVILHDRARLFSVHNEE